MKANSCLTILLLIVMQAMCFAQNKAETDILKSEQLYLVSDGHYIKFNDLKNSSIPKLFGHPLKIKNEKWETNNAKNNRTYVYNNGEIVLEDGVLSFIDIKKKGWYFAFKRGKTFTKPLTIGSSILELKKQFPVSWQNKRDKLIYVQIEGCDCSISFNYSGNFITELGFYSDES